MKPCKKCGATERYKDGRCKSCQRASNKKYYENNLEKARESRKRWKRENPEKQREYSRKWNANNPRVKSQVEEPPEEEPQEEELTAFDIMNFQIQRDLYKKYKKHMNYVKKAQRYYRTVGWRKS